jgi:hypothetical protein
MKQIAILASLTLALVLLAVNVAAAEDCYATNCAINAPGQSQNSGTSAPDPKVEDTMKNLSTTTERALAKPNKPEPPKSPGQQPPR